MTAPWRIRLCGELTVELAGERRDAALRGRQGRLLFAYLVLHRARPVRRDELIEALWAHDGAPPSETALAPVLSRLRRAVEPAAVEGRDTLQLVFPPQAWVDVEVVAGLVAAARSARGREAVAAATEAAELAAPGLLPGFDAAWLAGPRADLEELRAEALELAAQAGLRLGGDALPGAERAARAAVAAAPFRESARAALIGVLAARGNVAEAIRAFDDIRVLLREELGTLPGPELMALNDRLLAQPAPAPARSRATPADLVEREAELDAIAAALERLASGHGGVLAFEGPAGIGKTRLLSTLRERALAAGATVLDARASLLEREFGFGVVRQLFESAAEAPTGAAASAGAVFGDGAAAAGDGLFSLLNALFHYTAALAARGPLVLCVDDLQWSDPASLRFVAYLARRIAGLPVLVATTVRTGEPGVDELLLGEIGQDAATAAIHPRPLTAEGTAGLVGAHLGGVADPAFASACLEVTAGNPLLLRQLLTALAAERVAPVAEHAASVRAIGPRAVSRTVLLRLARLPEPAAAVARAVAVLGENAGLTAAAGLAEIEEHEAAEAIDALARAEILRAEEPLGFVHPLVRDAVYSELPAARRGVEHARAARLLAGLGASPERIAAQLMLAPARSDAWVVERLREAARVAISRGAPDAALAHLQRAQEEPPWPDVRTPLALELGAAAEFVRGPAAVEALRRAYGGLTDPVARGEAAIMLARTLLFMETPAEAIAVVDAARDELGAEHEDLHQALHALRIVGVFFGVADPSDLDSLEPVRVGPRGTGPGAKTLTAITAYALALQSGDALEAAALAREALDGDEMPAFDRGIFTVLPAAALALAEPAAAEPEWRRIRALAGRRGSVLDAIGADLWGGLTSIWMGDLATAIERLERAMEGEALFGSSVSAHMGYTPAFLALAWQERGERDRAWAALGLTGDHTGPSDGERFWLASRAELLLAEGEHAEVHAIAGQLAGTRPEDTHPLWSPWRSLRARAAAAAGDRDTASRLAAEELALARRGGAPWVVGRALRLVGAIAGEAAPLREAVALLDGTSARLERAKAHAALGDVLGDAASWRTALELAERCGADGLAARMRALLDEQG
ncbi:ATP-binding protein [Candidatus Solirubrobacter pratensis]|uniref:ATP-binding protein n=1 Tax=Candidatus Solirubrobacter pratensis TaxID=1298857 RepID=UPI000412A88B|nr:AAA family ATPase [Candidatus Solirubrobacter pratensis]